MHRKAICLSTVYFLSLVSYAQVQIQNVLNRDNITLNGKWNYILDPYESGYYNYHYRQRDQEENPGNDAVFMNTQMQRPSDLVEYDFDKSPAMMIPGDWNSQEEKLLYYEGTVWFRRMFDFQDISTAERVFVHFGAVNYRADVYLNGTKLGIHEGGFTPFVFEVTGLLKSKDNFLIVKADNTRKREAVPTVITDWWNYGGITRDVTLVKVPSNFITDYKIQLEKGNSKTIAGYVQLDGSELAGKPVKVSIPELKVEQSFTTDERGRAKIRFDVKKLKRWSTSDPKLYECIIKTDEDQLSDQIGFRNIDVKGVDILLNDQPVFLRGISVHEENPIKGGRAIGKEDARLLLGWAKELGCNFVRLAHYPHNEHMVRMADEMGMLVWEENPVYWNLLYDNPKTYQLAEQQLTEVVQRDKNRASVIIWSMANETPQSESRLTFLKNLAETTRSIDNTRLISAALEKQAVEGKENVLTVDDPFTEYVDVMSFNEYVGWYDGLPEKCDRVSWEIKENKPVFISEFGGGALQGMHGDVDERWTEEFQEDLYIKSVKMLREIPQLRGMSPWILTDFRSPRRMLPYIQDGWNRKGLLSQTGEKKKAYFVMQQYYDEMKLKWE